MAPLPEQAAPPPVRAAAERACRRAARRVRPLRRIPPRAATCRWTSSRPCVAPALRQQVVALGRGCSSDVSRCATRKHRVTARTRATRSGRLKGSAKAADRRPRRLVTLRLRTILVRPLARGRATEDDWNDEHGKSPCSARQARREPALRLCGRGASRMRAELEERARGDRAFRALQPTRSR